MMTQELIAKLTTTSKQAEEQLQQAANLLLNPGNGRMVQLPGNRPVEFQGPPRQQIDALLLNGLMVALQNTRFCLIALHELRSMLESPKEATCGTSADAGSTA